MFLAEIRLLSLDRLPDLDNANVGKYFTSFVGYHFVGVPLFLEGEQK